MTIRRPARAGCHLGLWTERFVNRAAVRPGFMHVSPAYEGFRDSAADTPESHARFLPRTPANPSASIPSKQLTFAPDPPAPPTAAIPNAGTANEAILDQIDREDVVSSRMAVTDLHQHLWPDGLLQHSRAAPLRRGSGG